MSKDTKRIDHYLKNVDLPRHESDSHRLALRRQVLNEIERKHVMSASSRTWKVTLAIAAVIGGGALAATVGLKVYRYHFEGVDDKGTYHFTTDSETVYERSYLDDSGNMHTFSQTRGGRVTMGSDEVTSPEQAQQDLEEIALLREQDARELVGVRDMYINGRRQPRVFTFAYTLADGRVHTMNEAAAIDASETVRSPAQIERDLEEVARLRELGLRDVVRVTEQDIDGQTLRVLSCRYGLSDGHEMTIGEGDLTLPPPVKTLNPEQMEEMYGLKVMGRGEHLGPAERQMYGKTFIFERHLLTLDDSTVVTLSDGQPAAAKTALSLTDWDELLSLDAANAGETLEPYEDVVRGQPITFTPIRYILSDGTEVIVAKATF